MTVLSLRWLWPFGAKPVPEPRPEPTPFEKALCRWEGSRTAQNLLAYLTLEPTESERDAAVELFMCRGTIDPLGEPGTNAAAVLEAFRLAEPQIRKLADDDASLLDDGFVNNVELWQKVRQHLETYLPIGLDDEFELSIERMAALEAIFGDELSSEAFERGLQFMLELLGTLPNETLHWLTRDDKHMKLWQRALEVAKQFVRHADEPLTAREIALALKAAPPSLALRVQRELLAQK